MKQPINQTDSSKVYCEGLGNIQSCHLWSSVQDKPDQKAIITQIALVYAVFCKRPIQITLYSTPGNMLKKSPRSIRNKQEGKAGGDATGSLHWEGGEREGFGVNQHGSGRQLTPQLKPWLAKALTRTDGRQHPADSGFRWVGKMIRRW